MATVIEYQDDIALAVFRILDRKEYVPTPPSGMNVALNAVWFESKFTQVDDPGRWIWTSNT